MDEPNLLAEFLQSGAVVARSEFSDVDELAPDRGAVVPLHLLTDGEWVWSAALAYYVREHRIRPEPALLEHARTRGCEPAELTDEQVAAVRQELIPRVRNPGIADPSTDREEWAAVYRGRSWPKALRRRSGVVELSSIDPEALLFGFDLEVHGWGAREPNTPLSFSKYVTNDELDALTLEYTEALIGADRVMVRHRRGDTVTVYTPWPDVAHRLGRHNSFTSPGQARPHLAECTVSADRIDELVRMGRDYVVGPGWRDGELAVVRTFFAGSGPGRRPVFAVDARWHGNLAVARSTVAEADQRLRAHGIVADAEDGRFAAGQVPLPHWHEFAHWYLPQAPHAVQRVPTVAVLFGHTLEGEAAHWLDEVLANPSHDEPRLRYADAVDDIDPAHADFIRAQLTVGDRTHGPGRPSPGRVDPGRREGLLDRRIAGAVLPVVGHPAWDHVKIRRGFVDGVRMPAARFITDHGQLYRRAPVTSLRLEKAGGLVQELLATGALARLHRLELEGVDDEDVLTLATSPQRPTDLRRLSLDGDFGDAAVETLAACPSLGRLEHLVLHGDIGGPAAEALAASTTLARLRWLSWSGREPLLPEPLAVDWGGYVHEWHYPPLFDEITTRHGRKRWLGEPVSAPSGGHDSW